MQSGVKLLEPLPLGRNQASVHMPIRFDHGTINSNNADCCIVLCINEPLQPFPHDTCRYADLISQSGSRAHLFHKQTTGSLCQEIGYPPTFASIFTRYNLPLTSFPAPTQPGIQPISRSLTSAPDVFQGIMDTIASIPGSPPDLSASRSSKSSSYCSTSDGHEGLESDITNFEDIRLEDEKGFSLEKVNTSILGQDSPTTHNKARTTGQDANRKLPTANSQPDDRCVANAQNAYGKPVQRRQPSPPRRGFTNPFPVLSHNRIENFRSRSMSPLQRQQTLLHSPSTPAVQRDSLQPHLSSKISTLHIPQQRRGSWQPQRKSIQELESEYHDSDDELPDDASLWNVPLSPYPSADRSARSSFQSSPTRQPAAQSPGLNPMAQGKTALDTPPRPMPFQHGLSRNRLPPRSSSLTASLSKASSPQNSYSRRYTRSKSWNLAMDELNEEAKIISEALEYYAAERNDEANNGSDITDGQNPVSTRFSKTRAIQLPPLQTGTLDFMPISREKEAILSRTRPSWLPPKDPKEERRHLKEYQKMMAASIEAEKKKKERQTRALQSDKCETRDALDRIWQYYVTESTDVSAMDNRVYQLCWRGISPKLRGKVWKRTIGNSLGLTNTTYSKALQRAKEIQSQPRNELSRIEGDITQWLTDVERDAETAFPELKLFQRTGPLWQNLVNVCEAYSCYRSDVGYVYGVQLVAALLLLQVSNPVDAFILLANCLNRPVPLAFHTCDARTIGKTYNHTVSTLAIKFPRLHEYLFGSVEQGGLGFAAEEVFEPMFRTLFCNGLDVDKLCRLWDIWLFEGDKTLVHAAVAVLGGLQSQIFEIDGDIDFKRRNIQEMLGWGPFNRTKPGGHWHIEGYDENKFIEEIRYAGALDYRGR